MQSELFLTLKKAFDQARISELDDASALVLIERATPPRQRVGIGRRVIVMIGALLGLLAGLGAVVLLEVRSRADFSSPEAQAFTAELAEIKGDFGRLRTKLTRVVAQDDEKPDA